MNTSLVRSFGFISSSNFKVDKFDCFRNVDYAKEQ